MMDIKFEDMTVHNFLDELFPIDYKWFQRVSATEWLNSDVNFGYQINERIANIDV